MNVLKLTIFLSLATTIACIACADINAACHKACDALTDAATQQQRQQAACEATP